MAKFKSGDMIVALFEDTGWSVLMVNQVVDDKFYSLDDGNGFYDSRDSIASIDRDYVLTD